MIYTRHFGLESPPFTITPDTGFFFSGPSHQEALNTLLIAIDSGEGFLKITGEVGTGKTLICRKLLSTLDDENYVTAYIPNPYIGPMTLLLGIADELGIEYPGKLNQHELLKLFTMFLIKVASQGRRAVVCLDEAQALPIETLEALRLLTNLETEKRKLLQVVLFGQPELNARLSDPSIRQLKQRIGFSCSLSPLAPAHMSAYVFHRLSVAGYSGPALFTVTALRQLYRASRGVPRLINILSHKALLAAFGEGCHQVDGHHIALAKRDTESVQVRSDWARIVRAILAVAAVSVSALAWSVWS
ncbi:MAG: AAA family ATPase [Gammaproteobacteria bacterium]|nr:MAG: AAA family ATPase [Gammaproteobacteria bacterium]